MRGLSVWLYVSALAVVMVMMLTPPTHGEENREDWIDPHDMLNFDPSSNTMRKNKIKFEDLKKDPSTIPDPVKGLADTSGSENQNQDITTSEESCPSCVETEQNCPPCAECNSDCPPCSQDEETGEPVQQPCLETGTCPPCKCEPVKECVCEQAALPLLRKYVRNVIDHIGDQRPSGGKKDLIFHMSLSQDDVIVLEKFVDKGNVKHVHDVHDILGNMVVRVSGSKMTMMEKVALKLEDTIGLKLDRLIQFVTLAALASVVLLIEIRLQIAWRRRVTQLIVLMFVISIPWTWYDLYKQAEIQHQSTVMKNIPAECEGEESWFTSLKSMVMLTEDKCHEYHEHLLIDPIIKVPPTKAIAVTVVRFWVAPLKDIGAGLSEFIRALLVDLPLTLYPIAIAIVAIFFFMFLFMWFGYSVRLPFFLTIEPGPQHAVADNSQIRQAIEDNTQNTRDQFERIQAMMEENEKQIAEKLLKMEKQQQMAIEYNMSMDPGSQVQSPSLPTQDSPVKRNMTQDSPVKRNVVKVTTSFAGEHSPTKANDVNVLAGHNVAITDITATSYPDNTTTSYPESVFDGTGVKLDRGDPDNRGNVLINKDVLTKANNTSEKIKPDGTES